MKPFKNADFLSSVAIALQNFAAGKEAKVEKRKADPGNIMAMKDCIFVKDDYAFVKIKIDDIRYLKSDNNYVEIYVKDKMKLVRCKLSEVIEFLPSTSLFKCIDHMWLM